MPSFYTNVPSVEDVEAQMQSIREEVECGPPLSVSSELNDQCRLALEYANDSIYLHKVHELYAMTTPSRARFHSIRYARRDGNCFFRCSSFRLFELLLSHRDMMSRFAKQLSDMRPKIKKAYGMYSDDFVDATERLVSRINDGIVETAEHVRAEVNSSDYAYILVFFRYAVSLYIRENSAYYTPFIAASEYTSIEDYCVAEVEPPDHVSDNMQLAAFAQLFDVPIQVSMLDRDTDSLIACPLQFNMPTLQGENRIIYLLYRPGHYDILEK